MIGHEWEKDKIDVKIVARRVVFKFNLLKNKKTNKYKMIWFDSLYLMPLSAISWRPVLVVEEAGVPRENHRPWTSNW